MNPPELTQLAQQIELNSTCQYMLRIAFGIACIERVEHLLIDHVMINSLSVGKAFVLGECGEHELKAAVEESSRIAKSHPGTNSLDGSGSAAVSTSYGVVAALTGRALEAAEYAAYASVYSYASYAVTDLAAYKDEHQWQIEKFRELATQFGSQSIETT